MRFPFENSTVEAEDPNICPHCHVAITAKLLHNFFDKKEKRLISMWGCNNSECTRIIVTSHIRVNPSYFAFERCLNGMPEGPKCPKPIADLKDGATLGSGDEKQSKFIKTYLQSLQAEANGLDELAGMGYRKAIEYLVKDWAIQSKPEDKDKILSQWLSANISEYFTGDLKDILDRASWLGNDQTHYNKLFEEYDIEDLKELIGLCMVDLDNQFKKQHYIQNIERKKKKVPPVESGK